MSGKKEMMPAVPPEDNILGGLLVRDEGHHDTVAQLKDPNRNDQALTSTIDNNINK